MVDLADTFELLEVAASSEEAVKAFLEYPEFDAKIVNYYLQEEFTDPDTVKSCALLTKYLDFKARLINVAQLFIEVP